MSIKKMYYYLFYKLYKSFEISSMAFWSEWKASLVMDILVSCIVLSINIVYEVITKKDSILFTSKVSMVIMFFIISAFNYYIFNHKNTWKDIVQEFNNWSKKKNLIGGIIAWSIMLLIFVSVIFSFYLMSRIDWSKYR